MIQSILDVLTLKALKGSRTKQWILVVFGVVGTLIQNHVISYDLIAPYVPAIIAVGGYFGIEHLDDYFKKA